MTEKISWRRREREPICRREKGTRGKDEDSKQGNEREEAKKLDWETAVRQRGRPISKEAA